MKLILNHSTTNKQQSGTGGLQGWAGQDEEHRQAQHGCSARRAVLAVRAQQSSRPPLQPFQAKFLQKWPKGDHVRDGSTLCCPSC